MAEVREFLDVPVNTVKSRLHAAKKRMKGRLDNMVKETLHESAPGKAFNKRIRAVLEGVPKVSTLHETRHDGYKQCPESVCFASCLRSAIHHFNEIHDLMWKIWGVCGRIGVDESKAQTFAARKNREAIVSILKKAKEEDKKKGYLPNGI